MGLFFCALYKVEFKKFTTFHFKKMTISNKLFLLILISLTSCADVVKNKSEKNSTNRDSVKLNSLEITGDFNEVFKCEQAIVTYEEFMGQNKPYLMVELTRTDERLPVDISKEFRRCGYGTGNQDICFQLSIHDKLRVPFASTNNTYSSTEILQVLKLKNNESGWLKFTFFQDDIKQINQKYNDLRFFGAKITTSFVMLETEPVLQTNKAKIKTDEIAGVFSSYVKLIETISEDNIGNLFDSSEKPIHTISAKNIGAILEIYEQMITTQLDIHKELNEGDVTAIALYKKAIDQYLDIAKKTSEFDSNIDTIELNKITEISDQYMKILSRLSE